MCTGGTQAVTAADTVEKDITSIVRQDGTVLKARPQVRNDQSVNPADTGFISYSSAV